MFPVMLFPILFAALSWVRVVSIQDDHIQVQFPIEEQSITQCLRNGLQARYRVEVQLCKRRKSWFDGCESKRAAIQNITFDAIARQYRVERDVLGDETDAESKTFRERQDALRYAGKTRAIPLQHLARGNESLLHNPRAYVSVNVEATCEGEYNETLSNLSYVLTLGLLDIRHEQSGWWNFPLTSLPSEQSKKTSTQ